MSPEIIELISLEREAALDPPQFNAADISSLPALGFDDPLSILGSAPLPNEPWWRRISPSTIFVLLSGAIAVLFLLHELTISKKLGFPIDEAWIDQVYARNFFHHIAFEFNPGERTAGPTAPLWTVFLALGVGIFHDPIIAGKLLGAIFLFLTGYYTFRLLRSTDQDYVSSLLGGITIITTQQLAWAELSGLESTLSTALVMGGLWWYFASPAGWQRYLTGAIFALASLTRPETTLIFGLLLVYQVWHNAREHRLGETSEHYLREALLSLAAFALVIGPMVLTNVAMSGAVVPETFYAGMSRESVILLARHGRIAEILMRLAISGRSIGYTVAHVYSAANPIFLLTIPVALVARYRARFYRRDASDHVFDLTTLITIALPYIRAVMLGIDDNFGEASRFMHFLVPIYMVCGLISLRILLRVFYRRPFGAKALTLVMTGLTLICGVSQLLSANAAPESNWIQSAFVLLIFVVVLSFSAFRYLQLSLFKPELSDSVTEAERGEMKLTLHDDEQDHLSERLTSLIRTSILIGLAWNLAVLPQAAMNFGSAVRDLHESDFALAKFIGLSTSPTDVIATDAIGTIGWLSDRRLIDVQGRLTNEPSYNARQLGKERGLLKTLLDTRPQYYASLTPAYKPFVDDAVASGFFTGIGDKSRQGVSLYRLQYEALPRIAAKWNVQ